MKVAISPFQSLTEKELLETLRHVIPGSSEEHKMKRIRCLEEIQRRIKTNFIDNMNDSVGLLLEMAKTQGHNQPESSLVTDCLVLFVREREDAFQAILDGLKVKENLLFIVFSEAVSRLNYDRKRQAIAPLVRFLVSRDALNDIGVKEVYNCLLSIGNEKLSKEIVKQVSQYLDSLKTCAIVFSVKLCSRFADQDQLTKMLDVLEKSMKGYFGAHNIQIERDICEFLGRITDANSVFQLMNLLKMRRNQNRDHITEAIGNVLNAHPYRVDEILDMLYDQHDQKVVDAILTSFEKMDRKPPDARKLLSKIRIDWWNKHPTRFYVRRLLLKGGESSKPVLFEILNDPRTYEFALECLQEIGITNEELAKLFQEPPMLQIYNFLYSQTRGRRIPDSLNSLWAEKEKLQQKMPGSTDMLEHLLVHVFSSFNFVTLNVAPLKIEGVDIVCFYPETLDLFVIGCTTGILKDDLAKMDALIGKMEREMPELFGRCSVTPIVSCSKIVSISPSDAQYASQNAIVIMLSDNIDKLMKMLNTNRQSREAISYIKGIYEIPSMESSYQ